MTNTRARDGPLFFHTGHIMARTKTATTDATTEVKVKDKAADFKRIAGPRVQKLLDLFDSLQNTTNLSSYDWTKEQAEYIGKLIDDKMRSLKAALGEGSATLRAAGKTRKSGRSIDL